MRKLNNKKKMQSLHQKKYPRAMNAFMIIYLISTPSAGIVVGVWSGRNLSGHKGSSCFWGKAVSRADTIGIELLDCRCLFCEAAKKVKLHCSALGKFT